MGRVDLDALDAAYQDGTLTWDHLNVIPELVAELRVAREVAEAGRWATESATPERVMRLKRARAAYREWCDRHAEPSAPDPAGAP